MDPPRTEWACEVCPERRKASYTCPRCRAHYCSVSCYKQHNAECTNQFQSAVVQEGMRGQRVDDEARQEMLEILQREREEISADESPASYLAGFLGSDEVEEAALEEALQQLEELERSAAPAHIREARTLEIISQLPQDCRQRFLEAVRSGEAFNMLPPFTPWWELPPEGDEEGMNAWPEVPECIPPFVHRATSQLCFNLMDIIFHYTLAHLAVRGDWTTDPTEFADLLLVAQSLHPPRAGQQPVSYASAEEVWARASAALPSRLPDAYRELGQGVQGRTFAVGGLAASSCIIAEPRKVLAALADMHNATEAAEPLVQGKKATLLLHVRRKLEFFLSWAAAAPAPLFVSLSTALVRVHQHETGMLQATRQAAETRQRPHDALAAGMSLVEEMH